MSSVPASRTSKPAEVGLWVLQALLVAVFAFSGVSLSTAATGGTFTEIGAEWLRYVTGVLDIAGAVGLLVLVTAVAWSRRDQVVTLARSMRR